MENIDLPRFIMMIPTASPDREVDNCSCTINSSGEAYWSYFATVTSYSYGHTISPDTNDDRAFLVFPFGLVDVGNYESDDVTDSYGRESPHMHYDFNIWNIGPLNSYKNGD